MIGWAALKPSRESDRKGEGDSDIDRNFISIFNYCRVTLSVEYWSEIKVYQSFAFPLLNNSFSLRFLSDIFSRIITEECSCDFLSYCSFVVTFE